MKYLKQFGIIMGIAFLGELLNMFIPLPVSASVYGIIILFLCLNFRIIKVSDVKETSRFLIEIMPLMFVPAAVGLIEMWDVLRVSWLPYLAITAASTFAVMIVSGHVTQFMSRKKEKNGEADS